MVYIPPNDDGPPVNKTFTRTENLRNVYYTHMLDYMQWGQVEFVYPDEKQEGTLYLPYHAVTKRKQGDKMANRVRRKLTSSQQSHKGRVTSKRHTRRPREWPMSLGDVGRRNISWS
jgi:hypothetical protein